jgi:general secretion pathway protein M
VIARFDPATLPTGRNGRILAVGLALVVLGVAWMLAISPLIGWYEDRSAALTERIAVARHMESIAAELPVAQREAALARTQSVATDIVLAGSSDPIAGANLESLIDGMTHDAGATLISTESAPAVQTGAFRRIGLHVTVRAPWSNLIGLLAAIERAKPRMSIGDLQIQAGPLGGAQQLLDMSFSVSAFRAGTAAAVSDTPADGDASQ